MFKNGYLYTAIGELIGPGNQKIPIETPYEDDTSENISLTGPVPGVNISVKPPKAVLARYRTHHAEKAIYKNEKYSQNDYGFLKVLCEKYTDLKDIRKDLSVNSAVFTADNKLNLKKLGAFFRKKSKRISCPR